MDNPKILEAIYIYGNVAEALVWFGFALRFWWKHRQLSQRSPRKMPLEQRTAIAFFLFGCSDLVETQTLAWWRPWWLLLWKAGCVLAILWLFWCSRNQKTRK